MELFDYLKLIAPPFLVSLIAVGIVHPSIVKIAKIKGIVDTPNARKLQKEPVPVLGGTAVFFGMFMSLSIANALAACSGLYVLMSVMMLMLYLGTIDDILDLRPRIRFVIQIIAALALVYLGGGNYKIESMLGLWGICVLPQWSAVLLTVFAIVGIVNAINLIDGVDGLCSGFGVMSGIIFLVAFLYVGDYTMVLLCASLIGALILFFFHNVFGLRTKMFIGDGGTLVVGIIIAACVIRLIHAVYIQHDMAPVNEWASVIPFTLAVLSVPVFDTLRVMSARMLKRKSPFHPDKTHLHHMFIELGFSHVLTTASILILNLLVVVIWLLIYFNGGSADIQAVAVLLAGTGFTSGLYSTVQWFRRRNPDAYARMVDYIHSKQPRRDGWFLTMQKIIDKI